MIRVLDFAATKRFYSALGLREVGRYAFSDFSVCYLADAAGMQLELIANTGRTKPYSHGEGFGNVAFTVPDAAAARDKLASAGAEPGPVKDLPHEGRLFARYFHVTDPDGYRVEVIEEVGHWQKDAPTKP
jgi:lactoylglutathione lyase